MKTVKFWMSICLLMTAVMLLTNPAPAMAAPLSPRQAPQGDQLVLGGNFRLGQGETLDGSLYVLGGNVILEEDSTVEKDVMVMGGNLIVNGRINGNITILGGLATLGKTALVKGDVNAISSHLVRDEGAQIEGKVNSDFTKVFPFVWSGRFAIPNFSEQPPVIAPGGVRIPFLDIAMQPIVGVLSALWWAFVWAVVAILFVLFVPQRAARTGAAGVAQPIASGFLGCSTFIVVPIILVLVFITICGIPFSLVGGLLLMLAWAFGVVSLGLEVGKRLADLFKQDWAPAVSAGVGAFTLTLVMNGLGAIIPCVGWMVPALVGSIGLGAVLLTRFGGQDYPPVAPHPAMQLSPAPQMPRIIGETPDTSASQSLDIPIDQGEKSEPESEN